LIPIAFQDEADQNTPHERNEAAEIKTVTIRYCRAVTIGREAVTVNANAT